MPKIVLIYKENNVEYVYDPDADKDFVYDLDKPLKLTACDPLLKGAPMDCGDGEENTCLVQRQLRER